VFSYVVLGAGFFTTQKSQEVVHSGVTQAASNIVVKGEVYGIGYDDAPTEVKVLRFDVGLAAGGLPVDIGQATLVLSTPSTVETLMLQDRNITTVIPDDGNWSVFAKVGDDTTMILKTEQSMTVLVNATGANLKPRTQFNLEVKPEIGASLGVQRTVPPSLNNVTLLY